MIPKMLGPATVSMLHVMQQTSGPGCQQQVSWSCLCAVLGQPFRLLLVLSTTGGEGELIAAQRITLTPKMDAKADPS